MTTDSNRTIELFFSYSHHDRALRDELETHLALLKRTGVIAAWHDRRIGAGTEWAGEIDRNLERARIILLLVSADFLSSDYCYDVELRRAMERHASGVARVIPVLLRAVDWEGAPFSGLNAVPTDGRPVTSWDNRDEAFADVTRAIRQAIAELTEQRTIPAATGTVTNRSSYYPDAQRQLIAETTSGYVGRKEIRHAFDRFLTSNPRGYFVIIGAPGQGKTSVAASVVKEGRLPHHFISRTGRRSDPRVILCSLLEQLASSSPTDLARRSVEQLALSFEDRLRTLSETNRLVVVIDALNELDVDVGDEPPFLPTDALPANVFFLLTSQPGERIDTWKEHLASIPHEIHTLAPLGEAEVREMIKARLPESTETVVASILAAARGTPLYVRAALDASERDAEFDPSQLPEAVEGYFRRATRGVAESGLLRDVLGLLAVSRMSLSLVELSEIIGVGQRRLHTEAIRPVRPFLIASGYRYAFYHQRFHDFVVRDVVYEDEQRDYHRMIADWLERPSSESAEYRCSSLAYHLFSAGDRERLLERIDTKFLSNK